MSRKQRSYATLADRPEGPPPPVADHKPDFAGHVCHGCDAKLPGAHLRTQLAPPHTKWSMVRTCDLHCLLDFLQEEEDAVDDGRSGMIFVASTPHAREDKGSGGAVPESDRKTP